MLPLSLLLLLATRTLASIPPDPFSHPKYSLSFLNDLPIEHSQAQRWIQNGLPSSSTTAGGVDVFFGAIDGGAVERERMEIEEKQEEGEVMEELLRDDEREGEGLAVELDAQDLSGDELDQIILSSPSTPPPDSSDVQDSSPPTSNYTLQHLLLPPGPRSYLCLLPPAPPQPLSALPPPPPLPPIDPALPEKLLSHLKGGCLYIKQGWFTYAYCHESEVRQFRAAPPSWPPLPGGYVPAIDATYDDYTLGRAAADINADQNLPPIALGRGAGQRYLVQRWGGGTVCDKTGRGREIEVQFHCSMTGTDGIGLIKEVSTCNYILIINTPRLCNVPGFSSTHLSEPPSGISCREIVPDGSIPTPKIDPESAETESTRTSKDRTPLPSWAILPAAAAAPARPLKNPLLSPKHQQLTPKPLNVAETFETILQRALEKLDLAAGATGGGEGGEDELLLGVGEANGDVEQVVTLQVSHDPETGEIRLINEDGSPFDASSLNDNDETEVGDAPEQHETLASLLAQLQSHQTQRTHSSSPTSYDDDDDELSELRRLALELEDEDEREGVLRELERMEQEEMEEEDRVLKVLEERVRRRREGRKMGGGQGEEGVGV